MTSSEKKMRETVYRNVTVSFEVRGNVRSGQQGQKRKKYVYMKTKKGCQKFEAQRKENPGYAYAGHLTSHTRQRPPL